MSKKRCLAVIYGNQPRTNETGIIRTVMSKDQYRRLELISQRNYTPDLTEKEIKALEKKLSKQ